MPPDNGFRSPLVGAGGVLIRDIVHSTDYNGSLTDPATTPGTLGWAFTADGIVIANKGIFRGNLIAGSIDIPDTTTAPSFHVDAAGNMWMGASALADSQFRVQADGQMQFGDGTAVPLTIQIIPGSPPPGSSSPGDYAAIRIGNGSLAAYRPTSGFLEDFIFQSKPTPINGYTSYMMFREWDVDEATEVIISADHPAGTGTGSIKITSSTGGGYSGEFKMNDSGGVFSWGVGGASAQLTLSTLVTLYSTASIAITGATVHFPNKQIFFGYGTSDYIEYNGAGFFSSYVAGTEVFRAARSGATIYSYRAGTGFAYVGLVVQDSYPGAPIAGIACWQSALSIAPILRAGTTEKLMCRNSGDTAHIPIEASAFTVISQLDQKTDIRDAAPGILERLATKKIIQFRRKTDAHPEVAVPPDGETRQEIIDRRYTEATPQDWANLQAQMTGPEFVELGSDVNDWADMPECVTYAADKNGDMQPVGPNLSAMIHSCIQAIQELDARTKGH